MYSKVSLRANALQSLLATLLVIKAVLPLDQLIKEVIMYIDGKCTI